MKILLLIELFLPVTLYCEDSTIDYCLILNILLISMTAIGLFKYKLHCEFEAAEADSDNSNMAAKTSTRLDIRASNEGPHEVRRRPLIIREGGL